MLASRRWAPERFGVVGDALARMGLNVVLTGTEAESPLTRHVASLMDEPSIDLAGATGVQELGAVIADARLLVSNDTGVSHIAAATRTPSVIIASGSDVERWAPEDGNLHRVLWHDVACRPCSHDACPVGHVCAEAISPEQVIETAEALLSTQEDAIGATA